MYSFFWTTYYWLQEFGTNNRSKPQVQRRSVPRHGPNNKGHFTRSLFPLCSALLSSGYPTVTGLAFPITSVQLSQTNSETHINGSQLKLVVSYITIPLVVPSFQRSRLHSHSVPIPLTCHSMFLCSLVCVLAVNSSMMPVLLYVACSARFRHCGFLSYASRGPLAVLWGPNNRLGIS